MIRVERFEENQKDQMGKLVFLVWALWLLFCIVVGLFFWPPMFLIMTLSIFMNIFCRDWKTENKKIEEELNRTGHF